MPGLRPVDSQISPYGPRISKSESASKWRPRRPKNGAKGMPQRNSLISRLRHGRAWDEWDENGDGQDAAAPPVPTADSTKPRSRRRRTAVAVTFAALFVAGAAFSAAAGDQVRSSLEDSAASAQASTDGTTTDPTATTSTDPAPAADSGSDGGALAPAETPGDSGDAAPAPDTAVPPAAV